MGTKPNPLWHLTITGIGSSKVADIDLGFDVAVSGDKTMQASMRDAARKYLLPHLGEGEGMRCWLGVSGNPRINIWMKRKGGQLGVEFENTEALFLIQHWCKKAGCPLH